MLNARAFDAFPSRVRYALLGSEWMPLGDHFQSEFQGENSEQQGSRGTMKIQEEKMKQG